jgi:hypothetical protein
MAVPQDWGSATLPFINSKGHVFSVDFCHSYWTKNGGGDTVLGYIGENPDLGFMGYLTQCDVICTKKTSVGIFDMPDQTWRDWYEDRMEPSEAVSEMLTNEGYGGLE